MLLAHLALDNLERGGNVLQRLVVAAQLVVHEPRRVQRIGRLRVRGAQRQPDHAQRLLIHFQRLGIVAALALNVGPIVPVDANLVVRLVCERIRDTNSACSFPNL